MATCNGWFVSIVENVIPVGEMRKKSIHHLIFSRHCEKCRGILKPALFFFGEMLPHETLRMAEQESEQCDLLMVIGSSLVVYPAAYMPLYAKKAGAKIVIINMGATGQDDIADVFIDAPAGDIMTRILERLKAIVKS
jgi:NAD-dependent deacetylase